MTLSLFAACDSTSQGTKGTDPTEPSEDKNVAAVDESWDYIKNKGTLIIGLDDTFCPMGFRDENSELVGFDIDLANALGERWISKSNSSQSTGTQRKWSFLKRKSTVFGTACPKRRNGLKR